MHALTIHTFNRNSLLLSLSREVYEGPKQVATIIKRAAERVYMENVQVLKNGIDKKEPTVPVWLMLQK